MNCSINDNDYFIEVGSDGYFNCSNCTKIIEKYFNKNNGMCE